jgi:hypothetical protein
LSIKISKLKIFFFQSHGEFGCKFSQLEAGLEWVKKGENGQKKYGDLKPILYRFRYNLFIKSLNLTLDVLS